MRLKKEAARNFRSSRPKAQGSVVAEVLLGNLLLQILWVVVLAGAATRDGIESQAAAAMGATPMIG